MTSKNDIIELLKELNLNFGDSVMIHTSLKELGAIQDIEPNNNEAYCNAIYEAFESIIDTKNNKGILVVPTFTHDYVRVMKSFNLEKSKSEVGIFSEYIRNMKDSYRTLHPINSVSIVGGGEEKMFSNISTSGYGLNSFFDIFSRIENSKIVYFGADINHSTYVHHIEHMIGVSYVYNKAYFEPDVIVNDKKVDKPFFNSVRYLDEGIEPDYSSLQNILIEKKLINVGYINEFKVMIVKVKDLIAEIYTLLQNNQCSLLKNNYYVTK